MGVQTIDLDALKKQIKAELLEELGQSPSYRRERPWDGIRQMIMDQTTHIHPYNRYQIVSAISILVRHSLGIRRVLDISDEQAPKAKQIASAVLKLLAGTSEEASPRGQA